MQGRVCGGLSGVGDQVPISNIKDEFKINKRRIGLA